MLRHAVRSLAFPARRAAALGNARGVHTVSLPPLDYDYGELEPVISGEIMRLHHQKHHQVQRLDPKRGYQTCISVPGCRKVVIWSNPLGNDQHRILQR
jgi:hypothetical protein